MSGGKLLSLPRSFPRLPDSRTLSSPSLLRRTLRPRESDSMSQTSESDVGIFCFASPLPGFRGVLKQRYSDFIVNEVDTNGVVVHLTCCDAPSENADVSNCIPILENEESKPWNGSDVSFAAEVDSFKSIGGVADAEALKNFLDQIKLGVTESLPPMLLSPDPDKCHRTAVHNFFKSNFKFLITDTVEGPDSLSKCVRVRFYASKQHGGGRNAKKRKMASSDSVEGESFQPFDSRGAKNWPDNIGKFLSFHLYKENKSTQEALSVIGKMLGVQQRSFGFAGTKDKRAITTQKVTLFKQRAKRLASLNDRLIGIKVGDFRYVEEPLVLGQLSGNRFIITLRGVESDSLEVIKAAADGLGRSGFINYFGLQRFGSGSVPTHLIGASLLRGEWKAAVDLILDPRDGERAVVKEAREYYKTSGDVEGTLRRLPRHMVAERAILQGLKKCPGNYLQALKTIPRTMRMMYVHSYQSYLWNHAASLRVQKHGSSKLVVGDLVYSRENCSEKMIDAPEIEYEDEFSNDEYACNGLDDDSQTEVLADKIESVKVLNDKDLEFGDYSFEDVVLPLPGSRVIYPMNDIASVYHDLAEKDGISLTEGSHNVKEFSITSLTGGYRRIFQRPVDYQWEIVKYTDPNISLSETDLDIIGKTTANGDTHVTCMSVEKTETSPLKEKEIEGSEVVNMDRENDAKQENKVVGEQVDSTGLKLSFTLPSSCYATMAIRELLKISTSVAFHKTLNE
ncbi:multisubstrate pseudouridine synthase 7 [Nymphaea colorata]|nr:multisubstrate pseudouridine synthase 7 [Nymphaea colorata]